MMYDALLKEYLPAAIDNFTQTSAHSLGLASVHCVLLVLSCSRDLKFIDSQLRQENTELRHRLRLLKETKGASGSGQPFDMPCCHLPARSTLPCPCAS